MCQITSLKTIATPTRQDLQLEKIILAALIALVTIGCGKKPDVEQIAECRGVAIKMRNEQFILRAVKIMPEYLSQADAMEWDTFAEKTVAAYDAVASANLTPPIDYLLECNRELELAAEYLLQQRLHSMN